MVFYLRNIYERIYEANLSRSGLLTPFVDSPHARSASTATWGPQIYEGRCQDPRPDCLFTIGLRMGRQSTFKQEIADEIVNRLSKGEPLAQICRDDHMPAVRTVYDWRDADAAFAAQFGRAREEGYDEIALGCLTIAEAEAHDQVQVAHAKLRIETRLKLLAKWDPRRYGDKVALTGGSDGDAPIRTESKLDVGGLTDEQLRVLASIRVEK